jgi:hypothetical protein
VTEGKKRKWENEMTKGEKKKLTPRAGSRAVGGAESGVGVVMGASSHAVGVICMGLDVLLQVLRALEALAAVVALVRLEGHMHADVGGDVVALDGGGAAVVPLAGQLQVVGALATNMALTKMLLESKESVSSSEMKVGLQRSKQKMFSRHDCQRLT